MQEKYIEHLCFIISRVLSKDVEAYNLQSHIISYTKCTVWIYDIANVFY